MIRKIGKIIRDLRNNTSGNALMLVGIGLPAFIGAAGLAVDTAQWYQWKRELQFAVDQAALAGAYARGNSNTQNTYTTRATQEYNANLTTIASFASTPAVSLADYNHGSSNSVIVTASASKQLPFSGFLIGRAVSVNASAQASFTDGSAWTSCLIAVDPDDSGAIIIQGSTVLMARCGIAALSTSPTSVIVNGNPNVDVGWVVSKGGIDDWFNTIQNTQVHEYMNNLIDPFGSLTPPTNSTPRTYTCNPATTSSTTTGTDVATVTTYTYTGNNKNSLTLQSTTVGNPTTTNVNRPTLAADVQGTNTTTTTSTGTIQDLGNGQNPRYKQINTSTTTTSNYTITVTTTPAGATMYPGTYNGGVRMSCDTVMNPGVYVMNGGDFETRAQYNLTASGVMIILTNQAGVIINGGANINMTAMTSGQLEGLGIPSASANQLAGLLVFEDRNQLPMDYNHNKINGTATTLLNGTIYLPKSAVTFSGTASVSSQCLMVAAADIQLAGDLDMRTFCPPGLSETTQINDGTGSTVRLVA